MSAITIRPRYLPVPWQPKRDHIYHMDALALLAHIPDHHIDMVLCDLPYGVTDCQWDSVIPIDLMWTQLKRVVKPRGAIVLTAQQPFTSRLVMSNYEWFRQALVWNKVATTGFLNAKHYPLRQHEDILLFSSGLPTYNPQMGKGKPYKTSKNGASTNYRGYKSVTAENAGTRYPTSVITISNSNATYQGKIHPTQKPVELFEYLIKTYTNPNETVLDMTCGSGTTAIACIKTDRYYICGDNGMCERTGRRWVDIARERVRNTDPYQSTILDDGQTQLSLFSHVRTRPLTRVI